MYKALNTAVTRLTQHAERVAPYLDTPMSDAAIKAFTKEINNISLEYHKFNKMYLSGSGTVSDIVKASSAEDIVNFFMRKIILRMLMKLKRYYFLLQVVNVNGRKHKKQCKMSYL